jgi:REP element-mobilizing transposase RayT
MHFEKDYLYHVYNRGNNRDQIFFNQENYLFFLRKIRAQLLPRCEILAYCLMPNHFHFLIYADDRTISTVKKANQDRNVFSEGMRIVLSTYTQAINKQEGRVGSLFMQNTESKTLIDNTILNFGTVQNRAKVSKMDYAFTCFQYIHQNPMRAGLVKKMEDWKFSSFIDYCGFRKGTLCNQKLAFELINFDKENFYKQSYIAIDEQKLKGIW